MNKEIEKIESNLSPSEIEFCKKYIDVKNNKNGTQAVLEAFKNISLRQTASNKASKLLKRKDIKYYIEYLIGKWKENNKLDYTKSDIYLSKIANLKPSDVLVYEEFYKEAEIDGKKVVLKRKGLRIKDNLKPEEIDFVKSVKWTKEGDCNIEFFDPLKAQKIIKDWQKNEAEIKIKLEDQKRKSEEKEIMRDKLELEKEKLQLEKKKFEWQKNIKELALKLAQSGGENDTLVELLNTIKAMA